jgi:hypothetical protein
MIITITLEVPQFAIIAMREKGIPEELYGDVFMQFVLDDAKLDYRGSYVFNEYLNLDDNYIDLLEQHKQKMLRREMNENLGIR